MTAESHGAATHTLSGELMRSTGLNAAKCYQCGKCSAGCPMATEMNFGPHQLIRLVQMDRADKVFADDSIWLCATCETCTT
ncbi:MAG: 4Fe-4S dicluster domain-containing protein, partial [Polyangiaceae bacterium]|nr:4Fe-4S dicluster domain-containing protein [Polyangiaceae bacterium]